MSFYAKENLKMMNQYKYTTITLTMFLYETFRRNNFSPKRCLRCDEFLQTSKF